MVNMTYACDECGKNYKWRDSLTRHNRLEHQVGNGKRAGSDLESEDSIPRKYSSLKRSKAYSPKEEDVQELKRSDAMPDTHFVDSRNYMPTQVREFKFKHPFCMMVCEAVEESLRDDRYRCRFNSILLRALATDVR